MHHLSLYFLPHEKNNHRALILQPTFLTLLIIVYLINQSFIKFISVLKPGVLGYSSEITITKVLNLTNEQRTKHQVKPLKLNESLSRSATYKANDMFTHNYWAHTSPKGITPWDFFRQVNYRYSIAGENLAKDFADTESVVKAWMKSPTHRANMISPKYEEIGIGVVNGTLNGFQTTLVVQHFGTPINSPVKTVEGNNSQVETKTEIASLPLIDNVLAVSAPKHPISPLLISKIIGGVLFGVIISTLIIDAVHVLKRGTHRLTGSTTGHVSFLFIIFLLLLFTRQGAIF